MRRLTPSGKHCAAHTRTHPECERRARTVVVRVKTHQLGQLRRQLRVRLGWESTEEGADSVDVMQCGGLALSMLDVQAAGLREAAHHHGAPEAHAARAAAAPAAGRRARRAALWRVSSYARHFCVRGRGGPARPCYQIKFIFLLGNWMFGHVATGTSGARPACPSPPIRPLPSGAGRNLAPKTTKVVIVGWWRVRPCLAPVRARYPFLEVRAYGLVPPFRREMLVEHASMRIMCNCACAWDGHGHGHGHGHVGRGAFTPKYNALCLWSVFTLQVKVARHQGATTKDAAPCILAQLLRND